MKRKIVYGIVIMLIIAVSFTTYIGAYGLKSSRPSAKTLHWGYHSTRASASTDAISSASGVWNNTSDTLKAYYNFSEYSGNIDGTDSNNSVGARVSNLPGAPSGWIGLSLTPTTNYTTFDIVVNANVTYGNGSSENYYDYQGVFTHEFGHVFGLDDLYAGDVECLLKTKDTIPTMYGVNSFDGTNNIFYYFRSLQADDISGKSAIASSIN